MPSNLISRDRKIIAFLILICLTAGHSLYQLVSIPADPKNSVLFGFSPQRLFMIGSVLAILTSSLFLIIFRKWHNNYFLRRIDQLLEDKRIYWSVLTLSLLLTSIGLPLLIRSPESFGKQAAFYIRFRPIIQLISLVSLQTAAATIWIRGEYLLNIFFQIKKIRTNFSKPQTVFSQTSFKPRHLFEIIIGFGLFFILISILWLPYRRIGYWLFYKNPWLGWGGIFCSISLFLICLFYNRTILRFLSILSLFSMVGGIVLNITQFNHINWYSVPGLPIERLKSNGLFDLFFQNETYQVARYSFFAILAEKYPQYSLTIDRTLLEDQGLDVNAFTRFGRSQSIEVSDFQPLSDDQKQYLLSLKPIDHKIYLKDKINFHFITYDSASPAEKSITIRRVSDSEVFVYPSQLEKSLP